MDGRQISLPTKEALAPIAKQFGLRLIVLFGSVARGKANTESDVDLAVLAMRPLTFEERLEVWSALSPLFSVDVDLAVLNHADPLLGFEVASSGKVLFENKLYAWEDWKSYTFRQYWDTGKFRSDLQKFISRRAEEMSHVFAE